MRVVEAAAICGGRFDRNLLVSASEIDERSVEQVIEELVKGRVFVPLDEKSYRFRHELLRELAAELASAEPSTPNAQPDRRCAGQTACPGKPGLAADRDATITRLNASMMLSRPTKELRRRAPPRCARRGARPPHPAVEHVERITAAAGTRQARDRRAARTRVPRLRRARAYQPWSARRVRASLQLIDGVPGQGALRDSERALVPLLLPRRSASRRGSWWSP